MSRYVKPLIVLSLCLIGGMLLASLAQESNQAFRDRQNSRSQVRLIVQLPQDVDVHLWVNGREVKDAEHLTDAIRAVRAEPQAVEKGGQIEHVCELSVVWEPNNYTVITRERTLKVKPGGD